MTNHQEISNQEMNNATLTNDMEEKLIDGMQDVVFKIKVAFILFIVFMSLVLLLLAAQVVFIFYRLWRDKKGSQIPSLSKVIIRREKMQEEKWKNGWSQTISEVLNSSLRSPTWGDTDSMEVVQELPSKNVMIDVELDKMGEKFTANDFQPLTFQLSMEELPAYTGKPNENAKEKPNNSFIASVNNISNPIAVPLAALAALETSTPPGSQTNVSKGEAKTMPTQTDISALQKTPVALSRKPSIVNTAKGLTVSCPPLPAPVKTISRSSLAPLPASKAPTNPSTNPKGVTQSPIPTMAPMSHVAPPAVEASTSAPVSQPNDTIGATFLPIAVTPPVLVGSVKTANEKSPETPRIVSASKKSEKK